MAAAAARRRQSVAMRDATRRPDAVWPPRRRIGSVWYPPDQPTNLIAVRSVTAERGTASKVRRSVQQRAMQMTSRSRRLAVGVAAMTSRPSSALVGVGSNSRSTHACRIVRPTMPTMAQRSSFPLRNNDWIPLGLRRMEGRRLQRLRAVSTMPASVDDDATTSPPQLPFDPKSFDPTDETIPPLSPSQFYTDDGQIPMPKALSPSAILEFQKCPQSYLFQYLFGLRQGTNEALARGTFCHTALENIFDLTPEERTLENLHNLFRKAWSEERLSDNYRDMFENNNEETTTSRDLGAEIIWGKSALTLLDNYYQLEDPRSVPVPNPLAREIWVSSKLLSDRGDAFLVRGIVDRVDLMNGPYLRIVDYKTGKCPDFKYSPATNERIAHESFFQLKIYALLLREMMKKQQADEEGNGGGEEGSGSQRRKRNGLPLNLRAGIQVRNLRLVYLTSKDQGPAKYLDCDLGATEEARNAELDRVQADIGRVWSSIQSLVQTNDPGAFVHCDRSFCWCHKVRPKFIPQTVWQRERPDGD